MIESDDVKTFSGGEIAVWLENEGPIHLKAVTAFGDPVELSSEEARALASQLLAFAAAAD